MATTLTHNTIRSTCFSGTLGIVKDPKINIRIISTLTVSTHPNTIKNIIIGILGTVANPKSKSMIIVILNT